MARRHYNSEELDMAIVRYVSGWSTRTEKEIAKIYWRYDWLSALGRLLETGKLEKHVTRRITFYCLPGFVLPATN